MEMRSLQHLTSARTTVGFREVNHDILPNELQTKYELRWECAKQIRAMHYYFDSTSPAVFATAVRIMDSTLTKVNVPWKYLSCFSAACYFLGCKWVEDEYQPMVPVLTDLHYKEWKQVDLRRMEEKVLKVLGWEMPKSTYLTFLPGMMEVLSQCDICLPSMAQIIRKAEVLLLQEFSFFFKPAAVALGVLEHCCFQSGVCSEMVSQTLIALCNLVQVQDGELQVIHQIINNEDNQTQTVHKRNKVYFRKAFENPLNNFCPDYRLHDIKEEHDTGADQNFSSDTNLGVSLSDCDISEVTGTSCESDSDESMRESSSCEPSPASTDLNDNVFEFRQVSS